MKFMQITSTFNSVYFNLIKDYIAWM